MGPVASEVTSTTRSGVAASTSVAVGQSTEAEPTAVATRPIRRDVACRTSLTPPHRVASSPPGAGPQQGPREPAERLPMPQRREPVARVRIFSAPYARRRITLMQRPRDRIDGWPQPREAAGPLDDIMFIIGVDALAGSKPLDRARGAPRAPSGSPSRAPRTRSTARSSIRHARVLGT